METSSLAALQHDWYVRNRRNNLAWREVNAQRAKEWREANPDRAQQYGKEYRMANAQRINERHRLRRLRKRVERKYAN